MALEVWSPTDLNRIAGFVQDLQDSIQALEQEHDIKVADILVAVQTAERPVNNLGLISFSDPTNTLLQFEAGDYTIGTL